MAIKDVAFLTGGAGFVGSAVARALLADGWSVRALVRRGSNRINLGGLAVETVEGDMRDAMVLRTGMRGARALFHVAADYRLWAPEPQEIIRSNVDGTRTVMEAALQAGIERVVYTSSVATLRVGTDGRSSTEAMPLEADAAVGAYKRSKVMAERLVERMIAEMKLPAIIVNPSTPIGPRDVRPTPTGRIIIEAASGRMPAFVDTGLNLVHVDDVATGHLAALRLGKVGDRYILGGENMKLGDMLGHIAALAGRKAPRVKLPRELIFPLAYAAEFAARFTKREPFVTSDGLRMAKYKMYFSSSKAQRDLGFRARPATEGLRDAFEWFKREGVLR